MAQQIMPDTKQLRKDDIKALAMETGPCLSLFASWQKSGNTRELQTRWKGLIRQAGQRMEEQGVNAEARRSLLDSLEGVLDTEDLTSEAGQGIAVFRSPNVTRVVRLPNAVEDSIVVADHFSIRRLLPVLDADRYFYILALSQKHMRLLRCTGHSSEEVPWPSAAVPNNLDEFLGFDKPDHNLENRSTAGQLAGSSRSVQFGTGSDKEDRAQYLHNFFRAIDKGLNDIFRNETAPLVLAGVEYELAIYRDICSYEHIAAEGVHGAPDGLKGGELHKRALEVAAKEMQGSRDKFLTQYDKFYGAGKASADIKEIVRAAYDGRVAFLFVTEGGEVPGNFDEASRRVRKHGQPHLGDEDLLNAAAIQTMLHSGEVFITPHNQLPNHSRIAAIFRY